MGPMGAWDEWVVELMRAAADLDLRVEGETIPRFIAAEGDRPLVIADVRPFPKGGYHQPLIELMALALPMGADRVTVGITGRVTSLEDPIPPVVHGVGDLRQRVLIVEVVDGHGQPARASSVLVPFDLSDDDVRWRAPFDPGPGEGWIPAALSLLVDHRDEVEVRPGDVLEQAERCAMLGHGLTFEAQAAARFGLEIAPLL